MAQILQTKTKETRDGATYYTADYVLTAGEASVSVVFADTPGAVQGITISDSEAGLKRARVTTRVFPVSYASNWTGDQAAAATSTVELVAGSRTEPIETFSSTDEAYDFASLSSASIKAVKDAVNADAVAPTSGAALNLYRLLLQGVTSYLAPSTVMRFTWVSDSPPSLVNLMKTFTPADAPDLPEDANWLFTNCSYVLEISQDGTRKYRITEEYTASGPGGWNANIYPAA
jgi:hypothetical protein